MVNLLTFREWLAESKEVEFEYPGNGITRTSHESKGHKIVVDYTHHEKNKHSVDFTVNNSYGGSNKDIPDNHKRELLRHLWHSMHEFITRQNPKELSLSASSSDTEFHRKNKQYETAAKSIAAKYNGKYSVDGHIHTVTFPHHNETP